MTFNSPFVFAAAAKEIDSDGARRRRREAGTEIPRRTTMGSSIKKSHLSPSDTKAEIIN